MPTPKYICDYCNKQFHDTPASRKRHMQGVMHQRAVTAWYDQFRDAEQDLNRKTGVCSYFQRTGTCHYGSNCFYVHVTPPTSFGLARMSDSNTSSTAVGPSPTDATQGALPPAPAAPRNSLVESKLPPSLRPPPEEGFPPMPFIDWG